MMMTRHPGVGRPGLIHRSLVVEVIGKMYRPNIASRVPYVSVGAPPAVCA